MRKAGTHPARQPPAAFGATAEPSATASANGNGGRELPLLAWLCSAGLRHRGAVTPLATKDIDWTHFAALARRHRVIPLLWRNLQRRNDLALPSSVAHELREAYQANALNSLRLASHLAAIVTAFSAEGIASVPLKGVCLAARYYDDIAARHTGDIDLLVAPADMGRANAILLARGYLRVSNKTHVVMEAPFTEDMDFRFHFIYLGRDGVLVELHFRLHNNPDVLPIAVGDILSRGSSTRLGKLSVPTMPDALQFVFLATHGARHEWVRLQWVCDIAVMVDRAGDGDVGAWLAEAARFGLTNPAVQALVLAERLMGTPLHAEASRAYRHSRRIRHMVRRAEATIAESPDEEDEDAPEATFKLARRFYRICLTSRPRYLWHEFWNGTKALASRVARRRP